jgi:hypothetical protein
MTEIAQKRHELLNYNRTKTHGLDLLRQWFSYALLTVLGATVGAVLGFTVCVVTGLIPFVC